MNSRGFSKISPSRFVVIITAVLALGFTMFPAVVQAESVLYKGEPAKNIILIIGDGLGLPQRTAAEKFQGDRLVMDQLPVQGITTTTAANRFITGSAAASTAMASGIKTNIGMVGLDPKGKKVKTLAELAKEKGMKVGIVSSVSIDHATPAAFYAHVPTRGQYYDIELAIADSGFDLFAGGGIKDPTNKKKNATEFKGDALEYIKKAGYKVITNKVDFMNLKKGESKIIAWNEWLPDGKAMPYVIDMTEKDLTLPEITTKAIELLENDKGFFLMIEPGKIDWACHANDATTSVKNTISMDEAVKVALEFAKKNPDTLLVVTGDHECGGLTLGWAGTQYESYFNILDKQNISFQEFSDKILEKYKADCGGKCTFDDVKPLITKHFGLKFKGNPKEDQLVLEDYQVKVLKDAYARSMAGEKEIAEDPATERVYGGYEPLTVTITHVLNNKAGLGWTSYKHTGVPIATSAFGKGCEVFNGYYDNTDIAKKIMSVMGLEPKVYYAEEELDKKKVAEK